MHGTTVKKKDMMVFKNVECSIIFDYVTLNYFLVIIAGIRRRWKISSEESLWDAPCMIQCTSCCYCMRLNSQINCVLNTE